MSTPLEWALRQVLSDVSPAMLEKPSRQLTNLYRSEKGTLSAGPLTEPQALAYVASRMPATYAAIQRVLHTVHDALPDLAPQTLLDAGSGPGTALWASAQEFVSLERLAAIESDPMMRKIGQKIASKSNNDVLLGTAWQDDDLYGAHFADYDLVVASYVMGELPEDLVPTLTQRLWQATRSALIIIEPGTPEGFRRIRRIRMRLLDSGAHIVAPCPHDGVCPMKEPDWCHFAVRLARSRLHRQLKGGVAPYEDEKYSYVAVSREPVEHQGSRVIRHPFVEPGRIRLDLCTTDGISSKLATKKKDSERFRQARKVRWGDLWQD